MLYRDGAKILGGDAWLEGIYSTATHGGKGSMGNTLMEVEAMRMSVGMDQVYGDYRIEQYSIVVQRSDKTVWFEFFNNETHHMQKGGRLIVPIEVAEKLGQALTTISASSPEGLPQELRFTFDESKPDFASPDHPPKSSS
jgi:hypothetical protein